MTAQNKTQSEQIVALEALLDALKAVSDRIDQTLQTLHTVGSQVAHMDVSGTHHSKTPETTTDDGA